ncbi:MAG TPA: hypothetical protein GX521_10105 [Firmicutes bacterium]|nr:hypothetical protein [Bacillota bacterium]
MLITVVLIITGMTLSDDSVRANLEHMTPDADGETSQLMLLDDDGLLDIISRKAFDYFWHEANPHNGLIPASDAEDSPCSIAAVGLGLTAIPVGIERGWISRDEGYARIITTLNTLTSDMVQRENGFFYQLIDMNDGGRFEDSKVSSMDTCILVAGALFAGEYFPESPVQYRANYLYTAVNWQWMMDHGKTLARHWTPESGFSKKRWDAFDESLLMYILAVASPTYPIPQSTWHEIRRPVRDNYLFIPGESLASYLLPHIWLDLRGKEDSYANYWNNAVFAARYNRIFCMLKHNESRTYTPYLWGLSKCEGPEGYQAYGASDITYDGTLTPYAPIGCIPFLPCASLETVREMLKEHGDRIWGKYGFTSGFNAQKLWWSDTYHGINEGISLLMIENYRTGLIWDHMSYNERIQSGLNHAQFRKSNIYEAVTPAYLAEVEGKHYSWHF